MYPNAEYVDFTTNMTQLRREIHLATLRFRTPPFHFLNMFKLEVGPTTDQNVALAVQNRCDVPAIDVLGVPMINGVPEVAPKVATICRGRCLDFVIKKRPKKR